MDAWIDAGAKTSSETCSSGSSGAGGGPAIGPAALPCTPTATFTAHAPGSSAKYHVPLEGNQYECFTFKSPWSGTTQATAWAPILGDTRVLHHWILFKTSTPQIDGAVGPCAMPSDATFVAGWAPGGTNNVLPSDVGLELAGPNDSLILQLHYHNVAMYSDADDASGVALCTTDTPRAHEAGVYTLGTIGIDVPPYAKGYQASGSCPSWATSYLPEPLTILGSFPHMHQLGRSFRTEIHRGSDLGPTDVVVDVPHFSFDDQRSYAAPPNLVFRPGDAITTTCTYDNPSASPVYFGERTEDEMCFDFLLVYPISIFPAGQRSCLL